MRKRFTLLLSKLRQFSFKKEIGISAFFRSIWKNRKPKPQIPESEQTLLDKKLSKYSYVVPTEPTTQKYKISIQEGFVRPTIGMKYTKQLLHESMNSNQL